jgi:hypothetical protein
VFSANEVEETLAAAVERAHAHRLDAAAQGLDTLRRRVRAMF